MGRARRHGPALAIVVLAVVVSQRGDLASRLTLTGILGIAVIGLSILVGFAGQVSLGHAGLVALGAYGSAVATTDHGLPPLVGVLVGLALTLSVALVSSLIIRLRGLYLALGTLALGLLIQILLENLPSLTGGVNGIIGVPYFSVGGVTFDTDASLFLLAWSLIAVGLWIDAGIVDSQIGRSLRAIHDDEDAALAHAVPVIRYKTMIWMLSAVYASLAGSLYAHYIGFIAPTQFGLEMSILLITTVVVGGMTSPLWGLATLVFLRALPDLLPDDTLTPSMANGLLLMLFMMLAPGGAAGIVVGSLRRRFGRTAPHAAD